MKKAIIILNMGGANSFDDVEIFLRNMFNDKHIINIESDFFRSIIANLIIWSRANQSKKNLKLLGGKSPLLANTKKLLKKLNRKERVEMIMRYTEPFADEVLEKLQKDGIEKLILFPLYPQYSTTTTLSSFEQVINKVFKMNWSEVSISTIPPYFDDKRFLKITANSILQAVSNQKDTHLIFSAHSLPQKIIESGDPYLKQIEKQINLLSKLLPKFKSIHLAFQSKLGPVKWLEPSLETKLNEFQGENIVIYPISFIIDNVETDFELNIEYREIAQKIGVKNYSVIRTLNDSEEFVKFIFDRCSE